MRTVWFAVLALVYLDRPVGVGTAPICANGRAGCPAPSLADLFERVIQQSSRMHSISADLHPESERLFFPSKNQIRRRRCHTYTIQTPDDKENAQRLGREELTEVILRLLAAWGDPLSQLHQSQNHNQNQDQGLNLYGSDKALEMSDMVQELKSGVVKVAEKMKVLGVISNTLSEDSLVPSSPSSSTSSNSMDQLDLLYCFRRDTNKVQSYLRILKCTIFPELDC